MNVHKFITKPETSTTSNLTIKWSLGQNLKYPPSKVSATTWEIFSQGDIVLQPKEVKGVKLGLGFRMSEGISSVYMGILAQTFYPILPPFYPIFTPSDHF